MRLVLGALLVATLALPVRAQEFGVYGVSGQVWDAGTPYHFGWGFSLGFLTKPSAASNRGGLRFTYDAMRRGSEPVFSVPEFGPEIARDVVDGPTDQTDLSVATLRWVFLPHITTDTRAEFAVGAAHEEGRNARGTSALLSGGVSFRMAVNRPYWLSLSYDQRFNRQVDPGVFGNPTAQRRGTFRFGLVVEPPSAAP